MFSKGNFSDHLDKLTKVLTELRNTGLRVNVAKSKFVATECEYLGYIPETVSNLSQRK